MKAKQQTGALRIQQTPQVACVSLATDVSDIQRRVQPLHQYQAQSLFHVTFPATN